MYENQFTAEPQRITEILVTPLRSLCVLCGSAVNETFLTSSSRTTRSFGYGSAALRPLWGLGVSPVNGL
jgi:hypothetical protein